MKLTRVGAVWICFLVLAVAAAGCADGHGHVDDRVVSAGPPPQGALFGAYVDPPTYIESSRIEAFEQFERQLGRTLDIYHDYHPWNKAFPTASDIYFARRGTLVLISWAGEDTRRIVSGADDAMIRERARSVRDLGVPVLLEWRWEMNRPNLAEQIHSPADYIAAWRHIHRIFAAEGAGNASWVWCPLVSVRADKDFGAYYPGDGVVDWICADGYAERADESFADVFAPFLAWAKSSSLPILIGEFGRPTRMGTPESRSEWLTKAHDFVKQHPQIKAVTYFESDRGVSGAYAVANDPASFEAFRDWALDPYFSGHS